MRTSRQPPQRDGGLPGLPGHTADLDAKIDDSFDRLTPLGERELGDASLSLR